MALEVIGVAHGGEGVARSKGKTVFVAGAVPGDVVEVAIVETRPRFDRGVVTAVLEGSASRVTPPCAHFGECGGCRWQMADYQAQLEWKRDVVSSQLRHLARLDVEVEPVRAVGDPYRYRNRMDFRISHGRPALTRARSHDAVAIDACLLLVPPLEAAFARLGRLAGERLTLRAGVNTGETATILDDLPATIHERVAGVLFRITGRAFFQVNTPGAEAMVEIVGESLAPGPTDVLLDGYAGGGLFAAAVGSAAGRVVAVESNRTALADLTVNAPHAQVVPARMERVLGRLDPVDLAVVDPPREGLGRAVVGSLAALGPRIIALVSCDAASFARDAGLLVAAGYGLGRVRPLDLFPQTHHVEIVGVFSRP
jgi:tRNA/tmRNA/rRNA uracil-C5-methylase (TrmA/RlmC/RlmD family)